MATDLHMALYKAHQAQRNRTRPGMAEIGLSPGQPKVLHILVRRGPCMQKSIAQALDIEPATVSRLLDNMEQSGMIRREAPADNRRAGSISITDAGREAHAEWAELCRQVEAVSLKGFTAGEKERFVEYLCRMYHNLTGKSME